MIQLILITLLIGVNLHSEVNKDFDKESFLKDMSSSVKMISSKDVNYSNLNKGAAMESINKMYPIQDAFQKCISKDPSGSGMEKCNKEYKASMKKMREDLRN